MIPKDTCRSPRSVTRGRLPACFSARHAATTSLIRAVQCFPDLHQSDLDLDGLSPLDLDLAVAIHRTTLQRWLTLEYLLDRVLDQPIGSLEPALRAVLLAGAAQLVFLDRLPRYAVVDESVHLARQLVRPGAAALSNAVLRRIATLVRRVEPGRRWTPGLDRLPLESGLLVLTEPVLPDPDQFEIHLSIVASMPVPVIRRWQERFGLISAVDLSLHAMQNPPTILALEPGMDRPVSDCDSWICHEQSGFVVWKGQQNILRAFLHRHPMRRVQDPASTIAIAACHQLRPRRILDYCAGLGTKTRQLATTFDRAEIFATDINPQRRLALRAVQRAHPNVRVCAPQALAEAERFDLLVLDVPCSNSAVLARRPEARYRLSARSVRKMVRLQQQIILETVPLVRPGGWLLYVTCSLEEQENAQQARKLVSRVGGRLYAEQQTIPGGRGRGYHDGSYFALIQMPDQSV